MRSSDDLKPLALPAYLIGAMLILVPLLDTATSLMPPKMDVVAWRFGALGVVSQAIMTPFLGGFLLLAAASLLGHRRVLRALQIVVGLVGVFFLAAIVLFMLDATQMRATVRPEVVRRFDVASVVALIKYVIGCIASGVFIVATQRAITRGKSQTSASQTPLVFKPAAGS